MQTELPRIHVWQDNETEIDLLGFDVHANLIRSVITDPTVLPVTVGVFGDWGGGKSSIMKMLQKELSDEKAYPDVVCLYFNGWTFEGYEDAKSALLSSILIQLGEHRRFGAKAKDFVVKLLKRLKWMESETGRQVRGYPGSNRSGDGRNCRGASGGCGCGRCRREQRYR